MTDWLAKLVKFLNEMSIILETSPAWLKVWVYVLIFLNLVTLGGLIVSYLSKKQEAVQEQSLQNFTIEQPLNNQEIPLGEDQRWLLYGKFPVVPENHNPPLLGRVAVEVFKLPQRDSIPQQGNDNVSTVAGNWRYDSATLHGEGAYEIVATASLGGRSLWREVSVKCTDKATAYRNSIERDRETRGAASLQPFAHADVSLDSVKEQLHETEGRFWELYLKGDRQGALQVLSDGLGRVGSVLPQFPNDFDLQNYRAYFLKDYAQIMLDWNRIPDAQRSLDEAATMFGAIKQQKPDDPSAWNGLGSVALMRGDPRGALEYINQALKIQPGYSEALHDREIAKRLLAEQEEAKKNLRAR